MNQIYSFIAYFEKPSVFQTFPLFHPEASLGEFFRLKVIDDFGNNPKIIKSTLRNILSFANFFPVFSDFEPSPNEYWAKSGSRLNFSMHLNNQITKTFIVKENKIIEIKKLLEQEK